MHEPPLFFNRIIHILYFYGERLFIHIFLNFFMEDLT